MAWDWREFEYGCTAEAELGFGCLGYASLVLVLGEVTLLFTECRQLNFFILLTAEVLV